MWPIVLPHGLRLDLERERLRARGECSTRLERRERHDPVARRARARRTRLARRADSRSRSSMSMTRRRRRRGDGGRRRRRRWRWIAAWAARWRRGRRRSTSASARVPGAGSGAGAGCGRGRRLGRGLCGRTCASRRSTTRASTTRARRDARSHCNTTVGAMPHVTRGFLPRSWTSVTLRQPRRLEPLAHGFGLVEAVLDDERAAGLEVLARRRANPVVERHAIGAAVEREHRLAPDLGRERRDHRARDVRRVRRDQSRTARRPTGSHRSPCADVDAIGKPVALGVALRDRDRRRRDIGRDDARRRQLLRECDRDRARAGAQIEHAARRRAIARAAPRATSMTVSVSGRGTSTFSST